MMRPATITVKFTAEGGLKIGGDRRMGALEIAGYLNRALAFAIGQATQEAQQVEPSRIVTPGGVPIMHRRAKGDNGDAVS